MGMKEVSVMLKQNIFSFVVQTELHIEIVTKGNYLSEITSLLLRGMRPRSSEFWDADFESQRNVKQHLPRLR